MISLATTLLAPMDVPLSDTNAIVSALKSLDTMSCAQWVPLLDFDRA